MCSVPEYRFTAHPVDVVLKVLKDWNNDETNNLLSIERKTIDIELIIIILLLKTQSDECDQMLSWLAFAIMQRPVYRFSLIFALGLHGTQ